MTKHRSLEIFFGYIPEPRSPADLASKEVNDLLAAVDFVLWHNGPTEFLKSVVLNKSGFGKISSREYEVLREDQNNEGVKM